MKQQFSSIMWCGMAVIWAGSLFALAGCQGKAPAAQPERVTQVEDNLPQPSDVTNAPQVKWSMTREDVNALFAKQGLTTERFQKRYLAYNGTFEGYQGRLLMGFEWEEGRQGPLENITLFLWPAKPGDANKQRQELFDSWNAKLTKGYGNSFKTEEKERTKSHFWQVRPDFDIELRGITATDGKAQIAVYWARAGAEKEEEAEKDER